MIPGLGGSPGEGVGNPLQYSCLEYPMDEEPGGLQSIQSYCLVIHKLCKSTLSPHLISNSFSQKGKLKMNVFGLKLRGSFFSFCMCPDSKYS